MSKSFHNAEPCKGESENTWYTPREIIDALGVFNLDPCTNSTRPFDTAKNHIEHDNGEDGFNVNWHGRVWMNPPYGKETHKWLDKLHKHGNGVALVFARCETKWAQDHFKKADAILFLSKRISFIKKDGSKSSTAACGSMLLAYGENNVNSLMNLDGFLIKNQLTTANKQTGETE